jgi:3-dehydroquinate synthase
LYGSLFEDVIATYKCIQIQAVESQKSYEGVIPIIDDLIKNGFRKNNKLIAIGGGIIQDVTAFISSLLFRGVSWILFPTTLLAQGDSCIGSKTSINFREYKNQLGGFYPPVKIYIDLNFLGTLKDLEIKSGLGEMCHYFIVSGSEDFYWFKKSYQEALTDHTILEKIVHRSLEIKKMYIEIDEYDRNQRQVFNYGHSFGHALESLTNYAIPHGIAVSYGMDMANFISHKLGYISSQLRLEIRELLELIWKDVTVENISIDKFLNALSKDKKNEGTELRLILNKGLGKIFKDRINPDEQFKSWIQEYFVNNFKTDL